MARPTGRHPRRKTVLKNDGVRDREIPHCNGCDEMMKEITIPSLHYWQPGFKYVRKYPFAEPVFFCDGCRENFDLAHRSYVLVPQREDQTLREALVTLLESLPEGGADAPGSDSGGSRDDDGFVGLCD